MAERTVIGERLGDSEVVAALPSLLRKTGRAVSGMLPHATHKRLHRAIERLFPRLRIIESQVMPPDNLLLQNLSLEEALSDPDAVERGWTVFQAGWQTKLIVVLDEDGDPIPYGKNGLETAACGLSMDDVEHGLVTMAADRMFSGNELGLEKLDDHLGGLADLPRLRVIAGMDALRLQDLKEAWGAKFVRELLRLDQEHLEALASLKGYALHALRQSMGREFIEILDWEPARLRALAEGFSCVEQYRDLGPYLATVSDPESILAMGRWETRDITDQVNKARRKKGREVLRGRRFETDIAVVRHVMGKHFETLLDTPPGLLDAVGRVVATTRHLKGHERKDRYEQVSKFADRYIEYLTPQNVEALGLHKDNPALTDDNAAEEGHGITFGEALRLLDGLWNKKGFGRAFFEGPFQTDDGAAAMRGLSDDFLDMKKRGSVNGAEVDKILASTSLMDKYIKKYSTI